MKPTAEPVTIRISDEQSVSGLLLAPANAQFPRRGGNPFKAPLAKVQYARTRDYDVRHLRVELTVDVPKLG